MSSSAAAAAVTTSLSGAQAVVAALMRHGITRGFGIPSIHNIAIYDVLRQTPAFQHWVVRHEQAAGYAADGYYRRSGKIAAIFASTGPGNLLTLVPLLESLQTSTPVVLIGTNVATAVLGKTCGALHETPHQLEIIRPLTRFATRITAPEMIPGAIAAAAEAGGPAFIEIPHDLLLAPLPPGTAVGESSQPLQAAAAEIKLAVAMIQKARRPVIVVGSGVASHDAVLPVTQLAEALQAPVLTTTSGKGVIADDHPLAMGCLSRQGPVIDLMKQSDLLVGIGARLTEFDSNRFSLKLPPNYLQIDDDPASRSEFFVPGLRVIGKIAPVVRAILDATERRQPWWDNAPVRKQENERLAALPSEAYAALMLLRASLDREDVVVNDQSILNYWASAFFPVLQPRTFIYPTGSGTLGYGLPAAIGAACAGRQEGKPGRIVCISGDGGFQYTLHELATLGQYQLPVKILLVNDRAYGIIGFLQRSLFGHTHEVKLTNPDFCAVAAAYGIPAQYATSLDDLRQKMGAWLNSSGPALLEWRTELQAPWEAGAIHRDATPPPKQQK
ncbi:MAG TPA: thiamine pyrophosphate-binding protein [Candidatus Saccharimonadales bacterium]|jgi:thiamine pyrophosphate-dependent acetolactate synthase large subunit-like protein|nr:thiamine pyrophosphate-binding protein [Candidatus Saccharimonadales bacterium]